MMLPASTCSPPKRFTPRRLEWESRPFLVLPPAFLCAMSCFLPGYCRSARADVGHLHFGKHLPVVLLPQVVRAALELHDRYLGALPMAHNRGDHVRALADQQDLSKLDRGAGLGVELLDAQHVVLRHPILLAARGDDRVHSGGGTMGPEAERPRILLTHPVAVKRGFSQRWQPLSSEFTVPRRARGAISPKRAASARM